MGPFDDLIPAQNRRPAPPPMLGQSGPLAGPPRQAPPQSPGQEQGQALQNVHTRLENQNLPTTQAAQAANAARARQETQQGNTRGVNFTDENTLRAQYQHHPAVQAYQTIMPAYAAATQAAPGGAGDLQIVYAFGKVMDPGSVVRGEEQQAAANTGGTSEQIQGYIQAIHNGGHLPDGVRERLLNEIRTRASVAGDLYRQVRQDYRQQSERYGFDPNSIMGQNAGLPFQQAEADFLHRPVHNMDGSLGPLPRDQQGIPTPLRPDHSGEDVVFPGEPRRPAAYTPGDPTPAETAYSNGAQQLFEQGATRAVMDKYAADHHWPTWGAELDQAIRYRDHGGHGARILPPFHAPERTIPQGNPDSMSESLGANVRGAANAGSGGLADPLAALYDTYKPGGSGTVGENLWRQNEYDSANQQAHPWATLAGNLEGAAALPTGAPTSARLAFISAIRSGATRAEATAAARTAVGVRLGMEGTAYGGIHGTASGQGDIGDRLKGGALEAALGGLTGGLGGRFGPGFGPATARADAGQLRAAQSAAELNIPLPRSVIGGEQAQRWATTVEKTPFGAAPVARGTETMINASQAARDRIAQQTGSVAQPEALGEIAQRGGAAVRSNASARGDRLYGRAETLTGDTRVPLPGAAAELDRQIAELSDTPGVVPQMLSTLQGVRAHLGGDWTPAGVRRMRTQLEDQFGSAGMRPGDASRRARLITDAAEQDMISGLTARGRPDAAQAWQAASNDWRQSRQTLQTIVEPILGRNNDRTAEEVSRALMGNAKGNGTRLGSFLNAIPTDEANSVRASIINQLGRSPPGQQNAAGEAFSLDTFLTHWNQIGGSRELIFPRETVTALNHLAEVADRARFAGRARNLSNTGTPMMANATAGPFLGAIGALAAGSPKAAMAMAVSGTIAGLGQRAAGLFLASPRFARALASTIQSPSRARAILSSSWVMKLARSDPAVADAVTDMNHRLFGQPNGPPNP